MARTDNEIPIDPSVKSSYESNPFDPMAQIRMTGRFLGSLISSNRPMNLLTIICSLILGAAFLLSGIFQNNPLTAIIGGLILMNLVKNIRIKKPRRPNDYYGIAKGLGSRRLY